VNTSNGMVTAPYLITYDSIRKGNVAYGSQSGFIGAQGLPLEDRAYPISKMCDFGNKCDVNEADLLDYLLDDPETKVISLHIEEVKEGRRFMDALRRVTAHKPVLVFKTGQTEQGATAAASHTGSLAGSTQVCDAALRQAGAITVDTWQEMLDVPKVFAMQPLPAGNRLGVVTATGGVGVVAIDGAVRSGLAVARLSEATVDRLRSLNPSLRRNPVDLGPTMVTTADPFTATEDAMTIVLDDPNVDCGLIVLPSGIDRWATATVEMFGRLRQRTMKPVSVYLYGTSVPIRDDVARQLDALGVPNFLELETAVRALGVAVRYATSESHVTR
jgi:acyl-CoA synthetase (NDP forming)